jgi:hypothetical protein
VNDLEHRLAAHLRGLADDLAGPDESPSPAAVLTTYRRRRRTHAGLLATAAAVLAIAVGVPIVGNSLSSAPAQPATPAPLTSSSVPTTSPAPDYSNPEAIASASARAAELSAMAAAAQAAAQPDLDAVLARLPSSVEMTSPTQWDQWLPEGRPDPDPQPHRDPIEEEAIQTCPRIAARLGADLGQEMSYWSGVLPHGPSGCTWVPIPLEYESPDYAYVLSIGFIGDGTTVDSLARSGFYNGVPGPNPLPCPRVPVGDDGLVLRCGGDPASTDDHTWTLLVPDARGAGVWLLNASGRTDAAHPSSDAFVALVEAATGAYG